MTSKPANKIIEEARLLRQFIHSGATVEDLARAWASLDGKLREFDRGKIDKAFEDIEGTYLGYLVEAGEILRRATQYALERKR